MTEDTIAKKYKGLNIYIAYHSYSSQLVINVFEGKKHVFTDFGRPPSVIHELLSFIEKIEDKK